LVDLERRCTPRKIMTVGFSTFAPGAVLLPHTDMAGRTPSTRAHLGLSGCDGRSVLLVSGEPRSWANGEWLSFMTGQTHQARNLGNCERVVLLIDMETSGPVTRDVEEPMPLWLEEEIDRQAQFDDPAETVAMVERRAEEAHPPIVSVEQQQRRELMMTKFRAICSTDRSTAHRCLGAAGWDLHVAIHREEERQAQCITAFVRERHSDEFTARQHLEHAGWDLAQAVRNYMPPEPDSPMVGRSFGTSNFRSAYLKATVPKGHMQLGGSLMKLIEMYCTHHHIPFAEDEGEAYFEKLQAEEMPNVADPVDVMAQRMWTSALTLRGREFCFILNDATRRDAAGMAPQLAKLARAINQLCVSTPPRPPFPPGNTCFRGGGFRDEYRSFYVSGRKFRFPVYFATSFSSAVANRFIARSDEVSKVRWIVHIDEHRKCHHVNLVKDTHFAGEDEYLFAPYSVFTVQTVEWNEGTTEAPHEIELFAAIDNKTQPEDLPLAPWS
jgi:hypothetical protein